MFCSRKRCGVLRFARPIICLGRLALPPVTVSRAVVWELWGWLDLARSYSRSYPRTPCPWVHAWLSGWQEKECRAPSRVVEDGETLVIGNLIRTLKNVGARERLEIGVLTLTSRSLISPAEFLFMNKILGALTCSWSELHAEDPAGDWPHCSLPHSCRVADHGFSLGTLSRITI